MKQIMRQRQLFRKRDLIKLLIFAVLLAVFILLTQRMGTYQGQEESKMVHDAIHRAVLTCYAVEGAYPDDLDYLKQNYHLSFDEERFLVTYNAFGVNMSPDIYVTERGAAGK